MVREAEFRTSKYTGKLVGDIYKRRVDEYGEHQKRNFKIAVEEQAKIEAEMKTQLTGNVPVVFLPYYIIFAKEVVSKYKVHQNVNLMREMEILQRKWARRGLDLNIMNNIKTYYVPGFDEDVILNPFQFDISLLDGTDYLE